MDKMHLKKFRKVMRISRRISLENAAKMMEISKDQLLKKLFHRLTKFQILMISFSD